MAARFARRFFIALAILALNLWKGAYEVEGLVIRKVDGNPAEPFVRVRRIDLEIQWRTLLRGRVVGEVVAHHPVLAFVTVAGEEEGGGEEEQTGGEATWTERLDRLFPFTINRFVVRDGEIRWRQEGDAPFDLYMTDFYLEALNVSNVKAKPEEEVLLAEIEAAGRPFGTGEFEARMQFDPRADPLQLLWEGLIGVASEVLSNQPTEHLAPRIELAGRTDQAGADIFPILAVAVLLRVAPQGCGILGNRAAKPPRSISRPPRRSPHRPNPPGEDPGEG